MSSQPSPATTDRAAFTRVDYGLYALVVLVWGSSWIALHYQLGVVSPEVSLLWRFLLSTVLMAAWVVARRAPLAFTWQDHLRFLGLGLLLFSINYLCFYYSGLSTPSGLLAVVFSLASVGNMLLGALFYGARPTRRMAIGAALGFAGIAAMFEPQIAGATFNADSLGGLFLAIGGTTCFCAGNMVSTSIRRRGVPVVSANAWSMAYGTGALFLVAAFRGQAFIIEPTLLYVGALVWLSAVATVIGFVAYLTLLGRIGAARAGYSTVMYPVVALLISSLLEGYVWTTPALAGLALVLVGNLLVLTGGRRN